MIFEWYGVMISIGFFCAYVLSRYIVQKCAPVLPRIQFFESLILWIVIAGIIGGRALFVIYNLSYFIQYPSEIPAVWHGGWVWHGALIGGGLALFIYAKVKSIPFLLLADLLAPGVILAQSIGRWGNYFNQELYGLPTTLPWSIPIDLENRVSGFESYTHFHPAFLYESLWDFGLFVLLFILATRLYNRIKMATITPGMIFALYLILYSFGRFFIEIFRIDSVPGFLSLRIPQWWSMGLICLGALILLQRRKKVV